MRGGIKKQNQRNQNETTKKKKNNLKQLNSTSITYTYNYKASQFIQVIGNRRQTRQLELFFFT